MALQSLITRRTAAAALMVLGALGAQIGNPVPASAGCMDYFEELGARLLFRDNCCKPVRTSPAPSSLARRTPEDPYTIGRLYSAPFDAPRDVLTLHKPPEIRGTPISSIPWKPAAAPSESELAVRLADFLKNEDADRVIAAAGSGGFSKVYFYDRSAPRAVPGWLEENAKFVIKVRTRSKETPTTDLRYLRRDLALRGVAEEFAQAARFRGAPFIRVARDYTSAESLRHGILVQEAVRGPSAYALAEAVNLLPEQYEAWGRNSIRVRDAKQLLHESGFDPEDPLAIQDLKERLVALEDFYRLTSADVLRFSAKNQLPETGNRTAKKGFQPVGLDFHHGENVLWDASAKMWVMFDW